MADEGKLPMRFYSMVNFGRSVQELPLTISTDLL